MSVNKAIILGHVSDDVESKYLPSGTAVTNVRVATSEKWEKDGEKKERTEWHRIKCFGKTAEVASRLVKGQGVFIEGKIQTRSWDGKDGQKKYTTEINAFQIVPLSAPIPNVQFPQPQAVAQQPQPQPQYPGVVPPQVPQVPGVAPPAPTTTPPWSHQGTVPPVPQNPVAPTLPMEVPPNAPPDDDLPF